MLQLPAKIHPIVEAVLSERQTLFTLTQGIGRAINIVFPQIMEENITRFKEAYREHSLNGHIYYALKVNQSQSLARQAKHCGIRIDVASEQEFLTALSVGFTGKEIEVTGPKNQRLLRLAVFHGCLINIDSLDELENIAAIAVGEHLHGGVPLLIRWCDFTADTVSSRLNRSSRFGIAVSEYSKVERLLCKHKQNYDLKGFSFHIDTNSLAERVNAIDVILPFLERAIQAGFAPHVLDIGGGYPQVFCTNHEAWQQYIEALKLSLTGRHPALSWNGEMYGFRIQNGTVIGTPVFYKYGGSKTAIETFSELLTSELPDHGGQTIGSILTENMLDLVIEPGKSIVDQAGATIAPVDFVKTTASGDILVGLAMKRDDVTPEDQEIMLDPILITKGRHRSVPPVGVYFTGTLCMEHNMITTHKTFLTQIPRPADLVAFINTAAYNMDLSSSRALMHHRLPKFALVKEKNNIRWFTDHAYEPKGEQYAV